MIISRTPFRVSFFGGGTDYPAWYREHGGAVLSTAINKYCYITCRYLPPFHDFKYLIRYYKREETRTLDEIQHPSVRESLRFMEIERGVDLVHHADLPARSGLGSSSTFTVGLLHALYALKHEMPTKRQLAINAIRVEQDRIGEHVGSQDQTAAAFGGLNRIEFGGANEIAVTPLIVGPERLERLQHHIMLFFTGLSRIASEVAKDQIAQISNRVQELRDMVALVGEAEAVLTAKQDRLEDFGRLLDQQWRLKRRMSSRVSTSDIDAMYETARSTGALGGKLLGAGGGGFLLLFVRPEEQPRVAAALHKLLLVPTRFDHLGSQIIYYSHEDQQLGQH
ncbi:kinase [Nitrospira sp. BLG_2]|uniref:GHMP family kinase ATP-binding protein n=1 Tax=Nitrospira sp. BLG_2 TaxID=3397507 RepID=UPI003B9B79C1